MATNTTKLGLIKPDFVDVVDVADLNTNADDIDAAVGFAIVTSSTRPSTPWTGQSIFETDTESSFIWDGSAWMPGGGGGSIEISATAPSSPGEGDLWWDSDNGNLYIYYDDGTSQQWVAANGPQVFVGTTAPAGYQGQLWFDSTQGKTYIYYDDGTSAQWVSAIGGSLAGNVIQVVSTTKTDTFSATSSAFVDVTGLSATIVPRSTSSKIFVNVSSNVSGNDNTVRTFLRMMRDSTAINIGDAAGSRIRATWQGFVTTSAGTQKYGTESVTGTILDSPSTTSSVTYKVQVAATSGAVYVNRNGEDTDATTQGRTTSTITLMEIAG
jgi:hypothetical protein